MSLTRGGGGTSFSCHRARSSSGVPPLYRIATRGCLRACARACNKWPRWWWRCLAAGLRTCMYAAACARRVFSLEPACWGRPAPLSLRGLPARAHACAHDVWHPRTCLHILMRHCQPASSPLRLGLILVPLLRACVGLPDALFLCAPFVCSCHHSYSSLKCPCTTMQCTHATECPTRSLTQWGGGDVHMLVAVMLDGCRAHVPRTPAWSEPFGCRWCLSLPAVHCARKRPGSTARAAVRARCVCFVCLFGSTRAVPACPLLQSRRAV